jgi:uracil-DNA glycosylase family 4
MNHIGKCNRCERAVEQMPSLMGENFDETRVMFVLHKPDRRVDEVLFRDEEDTAYKMALWTSKTGSQVSKLLEYCGMTSEDVLLTNLFKCTLPGRAKPRKEEYQNCLKNLELQVETHAPRKIIGFGSLVYKAMFPGNGSVTEAVGETIDYNGVPTLIVNHPSKWWAFLDPLRAEREYEKVRKFLETQ